MVVCYLNCKYPYGRTLRRKIIFKQKSTQIFLDISRVLTIVLQASTWKSYLKLMKSAKKYKHFIQLNLLYRSITISWHVLSSIKRSSQLFANNEIIRLRLRRQASRYELIPKTFESAISWPQVRNSTIRSEWFLCISWQDFLQLHNWIDNYLLAYI